MSNMENNQDENLNNNQTNMECTEYTSSTEDTKNAEEDKTYEVISQEDKKRKRKERRRKIMSFIMMIIILLLLCLVVFELNQKPSDRYDNDSGASIIKVPEGMSDEEIAKMLAKEQRDMVITMSSKPKLDGNMLTIKFANVKENPSPQVFKIYQDGEKLFESGMIDPGKMVEQIEVKGLKPGKAEVYVVSAQDGKEYGNSTSVEVKITKTK